MLSGIWYYSKHFLMYFWFQAAKSLGHLVSVGWRTLDESVQEFSRPEPLHESRSFNGIINFYYRLIFYCAKLMHPLNALLSKKRGLSPLAWNFEVKVYFLCTKEVIATTVCVLHPTPNALFLIATYILKSFLISSSFFRQVIGHNLYVNFNFLCY